MNVSTTLSDDLKGPQPVEVGPVAIPEELAMDFMEKCSKIPFKVQCLECSLEIQTALMLRQHMAETNRQHPVSSLADCNPVGWNIIEIVLTGFNILCSEYSHNVNILRS